MTTHVITRREGAGEAVKAAQLRKRVNEMAIELEDLRLRLEGQICRLANRLARLEAVTPAVQVRNGT